ncbi:ABC transporter permease [Streptomyces sp. V3I7]|uniref:ABC transporter permease n=1 Tax=Streptomyces sp. V3I7 TaxID=3042278 RepID=UPI002785FC97|nr:FtsX-like permease family protein [Streptomyces sp. V3I7]MDQ0992814.1 hypothetical protein [Streptomyces sp. V3I7]
MRASADLAMGVRFAVTGGREGWARTLLTGVGVGLGVALLLLTASIPTALAERNEREQARLDYTYAPEARPRADDTLVIADTDTVYRGGDVRGRLVEPEGARAPLPPGVERYPAKGDMLVSPALKELLASDGAGLLRERIPYRITGTIGASGLIGSRELAYYAGAEGLAARIDGWKVGRINAFGAPQPVPQRTDPVLVLLVLVVFVALLAPVAVFIATAVRFGGERRDRRLAALRLVGSDRRTTLRIAAGEALAGSLFGLVLGAGFFLVGRRLAGSVQIAGTSVLPGDLTPSATLTAVVALAVPVAAVLVTLFALRRVVIEPLGVVRTARPVRRRLWWRLLLPPAGLAMLYPMIGQGPNNGGFNRLLVGGGVILLLVGVTALLPWAVERLAARLGHGGVAWQLAVRRLQLSSGAAARMVNGIAVAVAAAIALQMLFAGVQDEYTKGARWDPDRTQMKISLSAGVERASSARELAYTKGVRKVTALSHGFLGDTPWSTRPGSLPPKDSTQLTVGDCAALREVARLPSCRNGDVFTVSGSEFDAGTAKLAEPGRKLYFDPSYGTGLHRQTSWTVPAGMKHARSAPDLMGERRGGFLVTPGALPARAAALTDAVAYLSVDESVPDVYEYVRTTAASLDPFADLFLLTADVESHRFTAIRTGLFIGAVCVLMLIGASLLVSQLEQLRERRKLLSVLVAFGTRRRTLCLSVLWQTAIPVALGLLLASSIGLLLGAVLLRMTNTSVTVDWTAVLSMAGAGGAVVITVTLLSLPPLLRLIRPDGLRTE